MTSKLIWFEEKKESFFQADPDEILFVKSADHYVKALIRSNQMNKWMTRHCTLKEMHGMLPKDQFIRMNRFYIVNRKHFSHINEDEKKLYLIDGVFISIPHRISPFIIDALKL
jgi:DNA-binding LytR/AlgR family response regulator